MTYEEQFALAKARLDHAEECLIAAQNLLKIGSYKSATNRAYYAVFHAMRAVLAFDEIDRRHHSGVISEFRKLYIKTGIFDADLSEIVSSLYDIRTESDYDDFFLVSLSDAQAALDSAVDFFQTVKEYVTNKSK